MRLPWAVDVHALLPGYAVVETVDGVDRRAAHREGVVEIGSVDYAVAAADVAIGLG